MSNFFGGMKIGVTKYGIVDFDNMTLDGTNYQNHGDSQMVGAPVINGFKFHLEAHKNSYAGEIVLKKSPYLELPPVRKVTYTAKVDVDFPITPKDIEKAGLEWLDSRELDVTPEQRKEGIEWLKTQTKFSVLDWYDNGQSTSIGADIIKDCMAEYLMDVADRTVTLEGETRDGHLTNFEADLVITKNSEPAQTIPIHEVVLENGVYQLFI